MNMNKKVENIFNFGENLRTLRERKGLTQHQLADISGISRRMIGHYETSVKRPSIDKIKNLAEALNVSLNDLMGSISLTSKTNNTSFRVMKKVNLIEKMPKRDQDMIFSLINTLAKKNELV